MAAPLRPSDAWWLARLLPRGVIPDPRQVLAPEVLEGPEAFSRLLSSFRVGGANKTTRPGRHGDSDQVLVRALAGRRPRVLDVGVSDGTTSLDLMTALGDHFDAYFVTDRYLSLRAQRDQRGRCWFYDDRGRCVLLATPRWVVNPLEPPAEVWLRPIWWLMRRCRPSSATETLEASLVQPALGRRAANDPRITIRSWNVFEPWSLSSVDVVKVANLLNRGYFPDDAIRRALGNLWRALDLHGLLLVVDNREVEKSTLFRKTKAGFIEVDRLAAGTEIADLVLGYQGTSGCAPW